MAIRHAFPLGAALLLGAAFGGNAQSPHQPSPQYEPSPYNQARPAAPPGLRTHPSVPPSTVPPSWYYNPYTDGTVHDPRGGGD